MERDVTTHLQNETPDDEQPEWKRYDKYYTPKWPVRLLLDWWGALQPGDTVAEPCCGRGDICDVLEMNGLESIAGDVKPDAGAHVPEADEKISREVLEVDCTLPKAGRHYDASDAVITNPPYTSETGTAGEVLESIVSWKKPTAALVRISWLEGCEDRRWAWFADDHRLPAHVLVLPRVDYNFPDGVERDRNPATSVWVLWHPWRERTENSPPPLHHFGPEAKQRYQGQTNLFGGRNV